MAYTMFISDVKYILSVCNVCVLVWIMSQGDAINNYYFENELKTAAILKLRQASVKHLVSIFQTNLVHVES